MGQYHLHLHVSSLTNVVWNLSNDRQNEWSSKQVHGLLEVSKNVCWKELFHGEGKPPTWKKVSQRNTRCMKLRPLSSKKKPLFQVHMFDIQNLQARARLIHRKFITSHQILDRLPLSCLLLANVCTGGPKPTPISSQNMKIQDTLTPHLRLLLFVFGNR